ncbi:unnamed protein product [Euphydryas editha]|uniref:Lipoprotein n=1 Tax=Euphydryas editha TaxID=104508 RepID=A0AAU9UKI6_EUPED|nr:unnamed protein product [Euphydryas editha]
MRALTLSFFLCFIYACQSDDLTIGQASYGDVILFQHYEHKYGFPFIVRTTTIDYPETQKGYTMNMAVITGIFIKDLNRIGEKGYATITAGGVGRRFVEIELKSQRFEGLMFNVTIYGKCCPRKY